MNLPYVFSLVGFANGIALIIIAAIAATLSLKNLLYCADAVRAYSYTSLARKVAGPKIDRVMTLLILISISGTCISEQIVITKLIEKIAIDFGIDPELMER